MADFYLDKGHFITARREGCALFDEDDACAGYSFGQPVGSYPDAACRAVFLGSLPGLFRLMFKPAKELYHKNGDMSLNVI